MPAASFPGFPGLCLLAAVLLAGGCALGGGGNDPLTEDGALRLLDRNPWAGRQRSITGRRIQAVEYHEGQVYLGFGDWRANTGPIAVSSWDIAAAEWQFHFFAATEAIERYRRLSAGLLLPYTDPAGAADYARAFDWREERAAEGGREAFYHVFDAAQTAAGLFLVGTRRNIGEPMVRHWDGSRWHESLVLEGRADWFWFAAVLDGELRVQSETGGSYRFDGEQWQPAEPLFANPRSRALVSVGGRVAAITRRRGPGQLQVSDGRQYRIEAREDAWDLNIDQASGWVYLLRRERIERSRDLLAWEVLDIPLPPGASALDVARGCAWIGTADSRLWVVPLPGEAPC